MSCVIDIEIYPNYFLFAAKNIQTGEVTTIETSSYLCDEDRRFLRNFMEKNETVGFNTIRFDLFIIYAALAGRDVSVLKQLADSIIVGEMRQWEIKKIYKVEVPRDLKHIDLFEVAPGRMISLKIYAGRIHCKRLQELPYPPDKALTRQQQEDVKEYCVKGDLEATEKLFNVLGEAIQLRRDMSKEYKMNLMSKSDPQIAEAVIVSQVEKVLKSRLNRTDPSSIKPFYYKCPQYISFTSDNLNELVTKLKKHLFFVNSYGRVELPAWLKAEKVVIDGQEYSMGIGGLHSTEACRTIRVEKGYHLRDVDVASFYPKLILTLGLSPASMGWAFLPIYNNIVERRLKAKKSSQQAKDKEEALHYKKQANTLKIVINGTYGKFGDPYSMLYAPNMMIQTTLTGQLALLMLIEEMANNGIKVVSANTDGIVLHYRDDEQEIVDSVMEWWQRITKLETEATNYKALLSLNVNSYLAFKTDGSVKAKGILNLGDLSLNPANEICSRAVVEYVKNGTPLMQTIAACKDFTKFVAIRKVSSGATFRGKFLGKTVRWYHSINSSDCIQLSKPTVTGKYSKVSDSDGAMPVMMLPDKFPDDIDYKWYYNKSLEYLYNTGCERNLVEEIKQCLRAMSKRKSQLRLAEKAGLSES